MVELPELPAKAMMAFRASDRIGPMLTNRAGRNRMALSAIDSVFANVNRARGFRGDLDELDRKIVVDMNYPEEDDSDFVT